MKALKVLFVCVHNSARSQMAETYFNHFTKGKWLAESAGIEKGHLNPYVVQVMAEDGFDIQNNSLNKVFDFFKEHRLYAYVVTVCDEAQAQKCPIFPGVREVLHWSVEDPSTFVGTHEDILAKTRLVREEIKKQVQAFVHDLKEKFPENF